MHTGITDIMNRKAATFATGHHASLRRARPSTGRAAGKLSTAVLCLLATIAILLAGLAPLRTATAQTSTVPSPVVADVRVTATSTPQAGPVAGQGGTYAPGRDVTYTVVVSNHGAVSVSGLVVDVPLAKGISQARWACDAAAGAACAHASGVGAVHEAIDLQAGASVTLLVTWAVPADYPTGNPSLTFTASAVLPAGYTNAPPEGLTASETDIAAISGVPVLRTLPQEAGGALAGISASAQGSAPLGTRQLGLAAQPAFPSCGPAMYMSQGLNSTTNTSLYLVDTTAKPAFALNLLGTGSVPYNALGFNPADLYMYAIGIGTRNLYRVGSDGSTQLVGAITGLPTPASGDSYNAGEIGTDGFMYVMSQGAVSTIYKINLTTNTATALNLSKTVTGADLAWLNGKLYTVNSGTGGDGSVSAIDPTTGTVTTLPTKNPALVGSNVGGLFGSSASGSAPAILYGYSNSGKFYEFDLNTGAATFLSNAPAVNSSDGAHCASAAVVLSADVLVTKTNTPNQGPNDLPDDTYIPGTTVTYTIVVTNQSATNLVNIDVSDPLPAGIGANGTSWTCTPSAAPAATCHVASGSGAITTQVDLPSNAYATFLFNVPVPANYSQTHTALTNTVIIALPPGYISPVPSHLTATDTDPASTSADLRVVKTASATAVAVGDTLTYTVTVDNPGALGVSNAILTDVADPRLDCSPTGTTVPCSASGGAVCPNPPGSVSSLLGSGITIPSLPVNGKAVFTLMCKLTR